MTKQEAFDKVWEHFVANKGPQSYLSARQAYVSSFGAKLWCRYRGHNGAKCAVGLLLPDELYQPEMEGSSAATIIKHHPSVAKFLGVEPSAHDNNLNDMELFFNDLQRAHDNADSGANFTYSITHRLRILAARHNLTVPATT